MPSRAYLGDEALHATVTPRRYVVQLAAIGDRPRLDIRDAYDLADAISCRDEIRAAGLPAHVWDRVLKEVVGG